MVKNRLSAKSLATWALGAGDACSESTTYVHHELVAAAPARCKRSKHVAKVAAYTTNRKGRQQLGLLDRDRDGDTNGIERIVRGLGEEQEEVIH